MIKHDKDGLFHGVKEPLLVMRYHSLVAQESTFPNNLQITAESLDDGEIMALKHKEFQVYGLQFHPESIKTECGKLLIKNFVGGICNVTTTN